MKTLTDVYEQYRSETIDGRDLTRLAQFVPEADLGKIGLTVKEGHEGTHEAIPFTRENVLAQLRKDVEFGFEKALGQRGISSSLMYEVVKMWNWVLEEGLEDFDDYPYYGLPLFAATATKYGFDNPIGDDDGSEPKYRDDWS